MNRDYQENEIRAFRAAVKRRAFRIGLLLFLVSLAFRRDDVTFGFLFGLCVGFINFNIMCRQTHRLLQGNEGSSSRRAVLAFLLRFGIISAAGLAVLWKGFQPIASAVGFFVLHVSLISYEITESLKKRMLGIEKDH